MDSIINWQALMSLNRPPRPTAPVKTEENMWDGEAKMYNKMSALEREMTLNQINAMPLSPDASVIDIGCGCGRISIPVSERVNRVTSMDSSKNMLNNCIANAAAAHRQNITPLMMDFFDAEPGKNVEKHDIAICSRSAALGHLKKLSAFANKYVAVVIWANAPSIPELLARLFDKTSSEKRPRPLPPKDRRLGYNILWNTAYDLGYEPNVSIVQDGFKASYLSPEEACDDLKVLSKAAIEREDIFRQNVQKFLTQKPDGTWEFFLETRSAVIWWDVRIPKF